MVVQDLRRGRVQLGGNLLRRSWQATLPPPFTSIMITTFAIIISSIIVTINITIRDDLYFTLQWQCFPSILWQRINTMLNCLFFPSLVASYAPSLETFWCFKKTGPFNVIIAKSFDIWWPRDSDEDNGGHWGLSWDAGGSQGTYRHLHLPHISDNFHTVLQSSSQLCWKIKTFAFLIFLNSRLKS